MILIQHGRPPIANELAFCSPSRWFLALLDEHLNRSCCARFYRHSCCFQRIKANILLNFFKKLRGDWAKPRLVLRREPNPQSEKKIESSGRSTQALRGKSKKGEKHDGTEEALEIISRQRQFHTTSSLTWMRALMERLGNPQDRLRYIHVTGTNGKGSTCTMLASVLEQAGYRTGKFISPYVLNFRERMQVNSAMISPAELVSGEEDSSGHSGVGKRGNGRDGI